MYAFLRKIAHVLKIIFKGMQTSDVYIRRTISISISIPAIRFLTISELPKDDHGTHHRWSLEEIQPQGCRLETPKMTEKVVKKWSFFFIWKTSWEIRRFLVKDHVTIDSIHLDLEDESDKWSTPPETNMSPEKGPFQKERIVFQPPLFRGHVSFRVSIHSDLWILSQIQSLDLNPVPELPKLHRPPHHPRHQPHLTKKNRLSGHLEALKCCLFKTSNCNSFFVWSLVAQSMKAELLLRMKNSNCLVNIPSLLIFPTFLPTKLQKNSHFLSFLHIFTTLGASWRFPAPFPSLCVEDPLRFHLNPQQAEKRGCDTKFSNDGDVLEKFLNLSKPLQTKHWQLYFWGEL